MRQRCTGRVHLFNHCGILLRCLVHVIDGGVDLGKTDGLFLGSRGNGSI